MHPSSAQNNTSRQSTARANLQICLGEDLFMLTVRSFHEQSPPAPAGIQVNKLLELPRSSATKAILVRVNEPMKKMQLSKNVSLTSPLFLATPFFRHPHSPHFFCSKIPSPLTCSRGQKVSRAESRSEIQLAKPNPLGDDQLYAANSTNHPPSQILFASPLSSQTHANKRTNARTPTNEHSPFTLLHRLAQALDQDASALSPLMASARNLSSSSSTLACNATSHHQRLNRNNASEANK